MLHNMLGFMKKTKHIRHNPESEGIYLSDLKVDELDPEVAALYFPTSYKQSNQLPSNPGKMDCTDKWFPVIKFWVCVC